MRDTSRQAYVDLLASHKIGDTQKTVLLTLIDSGPMTGAELNDALKSHSAHKRLSELERLGAIRAGNPRPCRVTGKEAISWEPTGTISVPEAKRTAAMTPSRNQIKSALTELRRLVREARVSDPSYKVPDDLVEVGRWLARKTD